MNSFSENNDFENILSRLLSRVDDSLDKRQGSIIYDALAPAAAELAQCYIALDVYVDQTYLENAVSENLDLRAADYGITRNSATPAIRIMQVFNSNQELMDVDIGSRFSIPNENGGYNFKVIEKLSLGNYLIECETLGTAGNEYTGELLPLDTINNLGKASITGTQTPGEDEETDTDLRNRVKTFITKKAFSGNKSDYQNYIDSISGIGLSKIFPVWNGGGTVKIAFLTSDYELPTPEFVNQVQTAIDPIQNQGQGIGLAPIGHTVTVESPVKLDINISATVEMKRGYVVSQVEEAIKEAIQSYLIEIQREWETSDTIIIYISRVIAAILSIDEVNNVSTVTINDESTDYTIQIEATNILFPVLNEVTIDEN